MSAFNLERCQADRPLPATAGLHNLSTLMLQRMKFLQRWERLGHLRSNLAELQNNKD